MDIFSLILGGAIVYFILNPAKLGELFKVFKPNKKNNS